MKKNLLIAIAVCALSAMPVMASKTTNAADLGLNSDIIQDVTSAVNNQLEQQAQKTSEENVIKQLRKQNREILYKINVTKSKEYYELQNKYYKLLFLMESTTLKHQKQENIGQSIFVILDDLAKALNALPSDTDKKAYTKEIAQNVYYFEYTGKIVNTAKLFDLATSWKDIYLTGNSAIEKSELSNGSLIFYTVEDFTKLLEKKSEEKSSSGFWGWIKSLTQDAKQEK